ncbi:MAG: hypothetical protein PHP79_11055, partial [Clostridia bacterium]|nr:hypothetical protein [Clostridia bacterium]
SPISSHILTILVEKCLVAGTGLLYSGCEHKRTNRLIGAFQWVRSELLDFTSKIFFSRIG